MNGRAKIVLNHAGVKTAALTSKGIRSAVHEIGERAAAATRGKLHDAEANPVEVIDGGQSRARTYVRILGADAAIIESRDRPLGTSIDSART